MAKKHSYVAFYMDAWAGGTARMTRLVRSVYFDVCFHNWDKVEPMGEADQMLAFDDLGPQGQQILDVLVKTGKLERDAIGAVFNQKAMEEGRRAADLFAKKSGGGKRGSAAVNAAKSADDTLEAEENRLDKIPSGEEEANASLSVDTDETPPGGNDEEGQEQSAKPERKTYDVNAIAEAWNAMAVRSGLAQIKKMTDERRRKIRARLDDYPEADIIAAINLIPDRPFCVAGKSWCTIDWLARPDTVVKLLEGVAYTGDGSGRNGGWRDA